MYTQEIIREESVVRVFHLLTFLLPLGGMVVGGAIAGRRKSWRPLLVGAVVGLFGPINQLLWLWYCKVLEKFGFDSVVSILVSLFSFAFAGAILGILMSLIFRRKIKT